MSYFDDASLVMIPSGYKDQKVYSVKPTDGSGDLTFTRASNATRVASNGLIEKVRTNIILQSQDFTTSWFLNVAPTITANTTVAPNGTTTADTIASSGTDSGVFQVPTVVNGVEYSFSIYVKNISSATNIKIGCDLGPTNGFLNFNAATGAIISTGAGITGSSVTNVGNGWYRVSGTYIATGTTNTLVVFGGSAMSFAVWGAQLETGVTTDYIATTSAAVSVGPVSGLPRLDYLNSSCPRLLLEPQRTNLLTYSEQIDNANWGSFQSAAVTANTTISPDGYQNADTITFGSDPSSLIFQIYTSTSATFTISVYAKSSTGKKFCFRNFDGVGVVRSSDFTTTSSWQRFTFTFTSALANVAICNEVGGTVGSIDVWGAQLEVGAYATSYIGPTLSTAVTRVADAASKTSISSLIGQTEGTFFLEINLKNVPVDNSYILLRDTSVNDYLGLRIQAGNLRFETVDNGVLQTAINYSTNTAQTVKVAMAYKLNDFVMYVNGTQVGTDTSATVPTCDILDLSFNAPTANAFGIAQAILFKTRLSNSDLAALTA